MTAAASPPDAAPPSGAPPGGPLWFDVCHRLPRRGQRVRIVTTRGVDHEVCFDVAFTEDWPAGVSWKLDRERAGIPFAEVTCWSPDPAAAPPQAPAQETAPEALVAPRSSVRVPGMVTETEREIALTGVVLRMLPPTHLDWTPHPTVPTLRTLAHRIVRIVARMGWILDLDEVELAFEPDLPTLDSAEEIVATFAANESVVSNLAKSVDTESLQAAWTLERNALVIMETTRGEALRRFGLTPLVHHRGEMSLMLAAIGVSPPHVYPEWAFADAAGPLPTWEASEASEANSNA